MQDFIKALLNSIIGAGTGDIADMLAVEQTLFDSSGAKDIINFIGCIGIGLTLIGFLAEINQKLAFEGNVTLKSLLIPFLKLFFALIVLSQGGVIIGKAASIGNACIGKIKSIASGMAVDASSTIETAIGTVSTASEEFGILILLGMLLCLLIAWILAKAITLVYGYKALVYQVEFIWRIALYPLALADIYSLQHSTAIRYLKGMLALGLYGMALIYMPALASSIGIQNFANELTEAAGKISGGADTMEQAKLMLDCTVAIIKATVIAPFVGLSGAGLARTAAKEALGA